MEKLLIYYCLYLFGYYKNLKQYLKRVKVKKDFFIEYLKIRKYVYNSISTLNNNWQKYYPSNWILSLGNEVFYNTNSILFIDKN